MVGRLWGVVQTVPKFGRSLKEARENLGLGLRQAAAVLCRNEHAGEHLSPSALTKYEKGRRAKPDPVTLGALARLYRVDLTSVVAALAAERSGAEPASFVTLRDVRPTDVKGFTAVRLMSDPIAAGTPLNITPSDDDGSLAFRERLAKKLTDAVCFMVGKGEESMVPLIQPRDVVLVDRNPDRRLKPLNGHIYAVNYGPLEQDEVGGAVKRIEVSNDSLVISSDNHDKDSYPTRTFNMHKKNWLDVLVGEVVWFGRYVGTAQRFQR